MPNNIRNTGRICVNLVSAPASHASPRDTHGPVVKTGPTAGQNRSRNKNGQWHKKRSDAGKPRG